MSVDNLVLTAYTETELGSIIETAVLRALQRTAAVSQQKTSPASMNLDNRTKECASMSYPKTTLTIQEAAQMLGVSKPKMYELAKQKGFPALHIGKRIVISTVAFQEWMQRGTV